MKKSLIEKKNLQSFLSPRSIDELYHKLSHIVMVVAWRALAWWGIRLELLSRHSIHNDPNDHMILPETYNMTVFKYELTLHFNESSRALTQILNHIAVQVVWVFNVEMPLAEAVMWR
jgi:hypothetical protein